MRIILIVVGLLALYDFAFGGKPSRQVPGVSAVVLSKSFIYQDQAARSKHDHRIEEGTLVKVIEKSTQAYSKNNSGQSFFRYKILSKNGFASWIEGENLAIMFEDAGNNLSKLNDRYFDVGHTKKAYSWVAKLEGEVYNSSGDKKPWIEYYWIISGDDKNEIFYVGGERIAGKTEIRHCEITDVTKDQKEDVLLWYQSVSEDGEYFNSLEVYDIFPGNTKIQISIPLNYRNNKDELMPYTEKFASIENGSIYVEWLEFFDCKKSNKLEPLLRTQTQEVCIEQKSIMYIWNPVRKIFEPFYDKTAAPPQISIAPTTALLDSPSQKAKTSNHQQNNNTVTGLIQYINYEEKGKKYLLIQNIHGQIAYIPADAASFLHTEYHSILSDFYSSGKQPDKKDLTLVRFLHRSSRIK